MKMANSLAMLCKNKQNILGLTNSAIRYSEIFFINSNGAVRNLYSPANLGIESYVQQRERTKSQFVNIALKFREKMSQYTSDQSKDMVFTDDLKNMLYIAERGSDVNLLIKMLKRFNKQNKQLRFGNFIFGPVIMRTFHYLNQPQEAFLCFKDEDLDGMFDQMASYQILLDLLYENQKYDEIIEAFGLIKKKQVEGMTYGKNIVVLTFAACYKLNTQESFKYALNLWKKLQSLGNVPLRRAITFCAGLAINQGTPAIALEILSVVKGTNYTTIRNLKVSALVDIGRVEEAVNILKSIITEDTATAEAPPTFDRDVIDKVKQAIEKLGNSDVTLEFNRILNYFEKQGHICDMTLDSHLCQEIAGPSFVGGPKFNEGFVRRSQINQSDGNQTRSRQRSDRRHFSRPGLADLQ